MPGGLTPIEPEPRRVTDPIPPVTPPPVIDARVARTCGSDGRSDCFVSVRVLPTAASPELRKTYEGQAISVVCQVPGQPVLSSVLNQSVPIWVRTADGGYVANVYIDAPGFDLLSLNVPCPA